MIKNGTIRPKSNWHILVGFLLRIIIVCIFNFTGVFYTYSLLLVLLYDVLVAYLCFYGNFPPKLLLGSAYILIGIVADKITFSIAAHFTPYDLSQLLELGYVRFQMTTVYLLICATFVWCLSKFRKRDELFLPVVIQFILIGFIVCVIITSDQLIGLTIELSNHSIPENAITLLTVCSFFILFLILGFVILIERLGYVSKRNLEFMQIQEQEKAERQHYQLTEQYIQTLRYWKHDYQNHLAVIMELNNTENYEKLKEYIKQLAKEPAESLPLVSSGNSILDAVISDKLLLAKKQNISFEHQIYLPEHKVSLSDTEFASILGNLLDNALEACRRLENNTDAYIKFEIKPHQQMFYLKIENSSNGKYNYDSKGNLKTSKSSKNHGLGLKRTTQLITKAGGFINIEPSETAFTASVLLPLSFANIPERNAQ